MNEQYWALLGGAEDDLWWGAGADTCEGHPCAVAFDPYFVLEQDAKENNIVGFLHTHPGMIASPSLRDHRTMHAWVACLGKPLVCCIRGVDGLRAHWYLNDEDPPVEYQVKEHNNVLFGTTPLEDEFTEKMVKAGAMKPITAKNYFVMLPEDEQVDDEDIEIINKLEKEGRL